jgi:CubicO group peptidase (beta-lactamase class C family)
MRCLSLLALCATAVASTTTTTTPTPAQYASLKTALQKILETATVKDSLAVSFGWKDANTEFSLAAGKVNVPGKPSRDTTTNDTFLYGSGTKTFTATAIM